MTITAQFRDGPLAGQVLEVDLEKHDHTDRKSGAYYVRVTEWDAARRELVSYFVVREAGVLTKGAQLTQPQSARP